MQLCENALAVSFPTRFSSSIVRLRERLASARIAVFDFETDGLNPRTLSPCGLGLLLPECDEAFYINCGHAAFEASIPLVSHAELVSAVSEFFGDERRLLIAHNALYDLRVLFRLGVNVNCRVACTQILTHRCDENLDRKDVYHRHSKVSYGLKELTAIYFNAVPPTLQSVSGGRNVMFCSPLDVGQYCIADLYNTWRLFNRCQSHLLDDHRLRKVVELIDIPNIPLVAEMMWNGIGIDVAEAEVQQRTYDRAIQACRERIWRLLKIDWPLRTRDQLRAVLRHLNLGADLDFDPFYEPEPGDAEPSLNGEKIAALIPLTPNRVKQEVMALILAKWQMEQRITSFLRPFIAASRTNGNRLYPTYFNSTLVTTRFSSSPNMQNLPGKADKAAEEWRALLPAECNVNLKTRKIFAAATEHLFIQMDFKSAEPRYLSLFFQRALEQRDDYLLAAKARLQSLRWSLYPELMRKKAETADDSANNFVASPISWPSYFEDPLWLVFKDDGDPYDAMLQTMMPHEHDQAVQVGDLQKWLKNNRTVGKLAFLALGYGGSPQTLAPQLGWTVERTQAAIEAIEVTYATLNPLRELTRRELVQLGEVRSLWGRPRRMNGYYQLVQPGLIRIGYRLHQPTPRSYEMDVVPLGSTQFGIQAFVRRAKRQITGTNNWSVVLEGNWDGTIAWIDERDAFVRNIRRHHFNNPPFANISISRVQWVRDKHGLYRIPARVEDASRQAFNAMCQMTGADHLRQAMNDIDREIVKQPAFAEVKLVLTVHDSIVYEAPAEKAESFARAAQPVMSRRPDWATIDFPVEVEIGRNLGEMSPLSPVTKDRRRAPLSWEGALDWMHRLWKRACARVRTRG